MKTIENVGVSRRHACTSATCEPHELALFGVTVNGQRGTFHDWLQAHSTPLARSPVRRPVRHVHLRVHRVRGGALRPRLPANGALHVVLLRAQHRRLHHLPPLPVRAALVLPRARLRHRRARQRERGPEPGARRRVARGSLLRADVRSRNRRVRRHAELALRLRVPRRARRMGRVPRSVARRVRRVLRAHVLLRRVPRPPLGARCGRGHHLLHPHRGHRPRADADSIRLASEPAGGDGATARRKPPRGHESGVAGRVYPGSEP